MGYHCTHLDFLGLGLPIAHVAMSLMGAMLVAQSAGMGPIDISSHIPGALVLAVFLRCHLFWWASFWRAASAPASARNWRE